jgi:GrpB-like predicted nucleotidyltransferase (UPF0157 family)
MGIGQRRRAALADLAEVGWRDMPVEIVAYDASWPASFEDERRRLAPLLEGVEIHHIGSTAVPGLAAKPIIDMIALVDSYESPVAGLIAAGGYEYPRAYNATLTDRRFLCFPTAERRTHHLHLVDDPPVLARYLRFRDRLRAEPLLAREYEAFKRSLAERYRDDREAYSEAKSEFVGRNAW